MRRRSRAAPAAALILTWPILACPAWGRPIAAGARLPARQRNVQGERPPLDYRVEVLPFDAAAINDLGQIAGEHFLWENGVTADLGGLGGSETDALALNRVSQVVGSSSLSGHGPRHAFLWEKGAMKDLGTLGGLSSEAMAINDAGQIVGDADTGQMTPGGTPICHAALWNQGRAVDLGTLGGENSGATAINQSRQVVGWSELAPAMSGQLPFRHAFLWEKGVMHDLGTLGGDWSSAAAINDAGQIVGQADTGKMVPAPTSLPPWVPAPTGEPTYTVPSAHAFLWSRGVMADLGTLGGANSGATAINTAGQIVGSADTTRVGFGEATPPRFLPDACCWTKQTVVDLTALAGVTGPANLFGAALAINNVGQVLVAADNPFIPVSAGTQSFLLTLQ